MMKQITDEHELHDWLVTYMKATGNSIRYPKPVVELSEFLIHEIAGGLDDHFLRKHFSADISTLSTLFDTFRSPMEFVECNTLFVSYAGRLYEEVCRDFVDIEHANRLAISVLDLGVTLRSNRGYFRQVRRRGSYWLKSTKKFERQFELRVALRQDVYYVGYI